MDPLRVARELADATRDLDLAVGQPVTADTITTQARSLIPDADAVSLTVTARRGRFVTLSSTSETAAQLDELQYVAAEGPCVSAASGEEWLRSGAVGSDERWPTWGPEAAALGVNSLLSVGLLSRGRPIGALNCYSTTESAFGDREDVDLALLYATHAAAALSATQQVSGLTTALHSRHIIGIAQGILMERYGVTTEQSFALLRRCSNDLNRPLAALAEEVVSTRQLPEPGGATTAEGTGVEV